MKERDTRVLILTSEQCLKFGFAWAEGWNPRMHFCVVDKEDVIPLMFNRLSEDVSEDVDGVSKADVLSGKEVQTADEDDFEEKVLSLLAEMLPPTRLMVMSFQDRDLLGVFSGNREDQIFTLLNPARTRALLLEDDFDQEVTGQSREQDQAIMSEYDRARLELMASYFTDDLSWI